MTRVALVLGATGQIGYAAARVLAEDGWRVRAGSRGTPGLWPADLGIEPVTVDREDGGCLAAAVGDGCDVLVDCVAYTADHGRQLLGLADRIGSAVVISSGAVYAGKNGQPFGGGRKPDFPVPIPEDQPTVAPGDENYGTRKAALEKVLLDAGTLPVTLLRAGAIHGLHSGYPREWYFVKRALDGRRVRLLAHRGVSRFHTIAAVNLAELIRLAAEKPGAGALNAGDPRALTVREIGAAIHAVLGHDADEILIDGDPPPPKVGATPWSVSVPVVYDMTKAERELGYRARTGYADSLPATVEWLVDTARGKDWRAAFPFFAEVHGDDAFDYLAEDAWISGSKT